MKSILCPIDFSDTALAGLEYAGQLAKILTARITLIHVRISILPEALPLEHLAKESAEDIAIRLQKICDETHHTFGIPCSHYFEATTHTLQNAIATKAKEHDLIVMGTDGANDYYEYLSGSNTYHVIENTKCPVILIPKGCTFRPIKRIVYAYDPDTNPIFLINQLKEIVIPAKAAVNVLHILEHKPSKETEHKLEILRGAVMARALRNTEWSFDFVYSKDVAWAMNQYIKNHNADILALSFHHRTFGENIFSENVIKQISMILEYPTLVFWR